ncbi:uncharacterized protein LOC114672191 [Macaca mulatta]
MGQEIEGKEKVRDALLVRPLMAPDPSTQHAKVTCGAPAASRRHSVPDGIDTQSSPNRDNTPGLKAAPCPAMKHKQATWREKTARVRVSRSHWQQELRVLEFPDNKPAVLAMFLETKDAQTKSHLDKRLHGH